MRALKRFLLSVLVLSVTLFAADVGTITGLSGSASIERDGTVIVASLGDKLQEKDRVITKDKTRIQIIFKDDTIISVGNNTDFSIKEYLFEDEKEPVAKFGMIKGAMRAITGKIGKVAPDKFSVQTKTATIGIRGTNFTLLAMEDGSHQAFCTFGAISVTYDNQEYIVKQGFVIDISSSGKVTIKKFTSDDLKNMKKKSFASSKKGGSSSQSSSEKADNSGQIDTTSSDDSAITIKNISESWSDSEQSSTNDEIYSEVNSEDTLTNSSVIAGYSMTNAVYQGDYTTTSSTGSLPATGSAKFTVNFNLDEATLTLDKTNTYSSYNVDSNTFSGTQDGANTGTFDGSFYGSTGKTVKGNFTFYEGAPASAPTKTAEGTYKVSTSQTLH